MATVKSNRSKDIVTKANRLIRCAARYGGLAFGAYVRDVVVPLQNGKTADEVQLKNIDLWFTKKSDIDSFCSEVYPETGLTLLNRKSSDVGFYCIVKGLYSLVDGYEEVLQVTIVLCDFFPVCDFRVNCLSWDGKKLEPHRVYNPVSLIKGKKPKFAVYTPTVESIVADIMNKTTKVEGNYYYLSMSTKEQYRDFARSANNQIKEFINRGWRLFTEGFEIDRTTGRIASHINRGDNKPPKPNRSSTRSTSSASTSMSTFSAKDLNLHVTPESISFTVPSDRGRVATISIKTTVSESERKGHYISDKDIYSLFVDNCLERVRQPDGSINSNFKVSLNCLYRVYKIWYKRVFPRSKPQDLESFKVGFRQCSTVINDYMVGIRVIGRMGKHFMTH